MVADVIDELAGLRPDSVLDKLRDGRDQARREAQASYVALFEPQDDGGFDRNGRHAAAAFVALLHRQDEIAAHYAAPLGTELRNVVRDAAAEAAATGPYGAYPPGVLSREDQTGPVYHVSPAHRAALGDKLAAGFEHAHMLVFHPRDATPAALQRLLDAGWSNTGIVTLSQLVAFLAFQIRAIVGLKVLAAHG